MAREREAKVSKSERQDPEATAARAEPVGISAEERAALMLDESLANALPNLPKVPGWHFLWGSTTNQQNPIQWFLRLGYTLVPWEEHKEYGHLNKQHSGEFAGYISCNEMVMMKVPEDAYQQIMREMHHDRPNREAERLLQTVDNITSAYRDSKGKRLATVEGDGYAQVDAERSGKVRPFE